jgi:hypothetical protein
MAQWLAPSNQRSRALTIDDDKAGVVGHAAMCKRPVQGHDRRPRALEGQVAELQKLREDVGSSNRTSNGGVGVTGGSREDSRPRQPVYGGPISPFLTTPATAARTPLDAKIANRRRRVLVSADAHLLPFARWE